MSTFLGNSRDQKIMEITVRVGGLGLVPDRIRERRLRDGMRRMGLLSRTVAEARPAGGNGAGRGLPAHAGMDPRDLIVQQRRARAPLGGNPTPARRRKLVGRLQPRHARRRPIPFPFDDRIT